MQAVEQQSAVDELPDPSPTESGVAATDLVELIGYLADGDSQDDVQLRESVAGETGRWLVLRREDIIEQLSEEDDAGLASGQSVVRVGPGAIVVFRATVPASQLEAAAEATRPEPQFKIAGTRPGLGFVEPDRWPRRG